MDGADYSEEIENFMHSLAHIFYTIILKRFIQSSSICETFRRDLVNHQIGTNQIGKFVHLTHLEFQEERKKPWQVLTNRIKDASCPFINRRWISTVPSPVDLVDYDTILLVERNITQLWGLIYIP